ncbi:chemotaxis protein CheB [Sorangium sp. So ce124]|uniref:chemotaxis protein CheB n=1 Tax=Sorangium sp. So ce124 TaxID=3133280 RepID=UPI003F603E02
MDPSQANNAREGRGAGRPQGLLVVGIGASAGGLEALEQFFSHVPENSGLAYVVIQHLAPQHASMLAELLGRQTTMRVVEASDGTAPQPDHVYVIAPGTKLALSGGVFQVRAMDAERWEQIDAFLRTLAEDRGECAIGVILSGSGGDGTDGLRAIQEHRGFTLAQTPETAKYDSMPKAAIEARVVDEILPAEAMPAKVIERAQQVLAGLGRVAAPPSVPRPPAAEMPSDEELVASLDRVYEILRRATGHDFSQYKHGTVIRRIRRRLLLRSSPSLSEYLGFLGADAQEPELLAKDLLIGVTQFFRDPEAFEHLGLHVLPRILASGSADRQVRIWVPGCASGEEAYSIGILMRERLAEMSLARPVQIFATDIDADAIAEARQGRYPADIADHVSRERLARFFTQDGSSYQVAREVREMCIFSEHSLIRDPPFLALDLISCRNVLIYLDAALQKKLIPVFSYALDPGGYLFLGPAEGLAGHAELFETVDKRFRIFKRSESTVRPLVEFPLASRAAPRAAPPLPQATLPQPVHEQAINAAFERLILQEYSPPSAVVNAEGEVLCVAGLTGRYLQPPAGILSTNILEIAHASLRIELRMALRAAVRTGRRVVRNDVPIEVEGSMRRLRLTVRPLPGIKQDGLFAVVLEERAGGLAEVAEPGEPLAPGAERDSAVEQLESELRTTRASLRATIEELESANEELKSSNEELLSTNEEMQSANEELQSSQEELKSVNEELATVNNELSRKVDELGRANNDLSNLFSSTDVATLFLDQEQRVVRFTPAGKALFRLIDADAGRPISDLAPRVAGQDLAADVSQVLRTLRPIERQVETIERQAWYLLRVLPYRTIEDAIAGAVVTLTDITQIKQAEAERERLFEELRKAQEQLSAELHDTSRLLKIGSLFLQEENLSLVLGEILDAAIAVSGADFGNMQLLDHASGELVIGAHRGLPAFWVEFWDHVVEGQGACGTALEQKGRVIVEDVEASPIFAGTPALDVHRKAGVRAVQSTPLMSRAGEPLGMLSTHYRAPTRPSDRALRLLDLIARQAADILERARAEEALRQSEERFRVLAEASSEVLYRLSADWSEMRQLRSRGFLADTRAASRRWLQDYIPPDEQPRMRAAIGEAVRHKSVFELEHRVLRADGAQGWVFSRAVPLKDASGEIVEWFGAASDVTERKRAGLALEEANARLIEADRRKNEFLGMLSHELRNPLSAILGGLYVLDRAEPGSEQARRAHAVIERQVGHLTRLIEDVLDVTRITRGKVQLQREVLDLNALTQRTVDDHRSAFAQAGVALELSAAPAPVWVNGDRTRLAQVLGNLLQNAAKFTPRSGKTTVSVGGDGQAIVRVEDTGAGIAPEVMPRVFEPFTQADTTLDRSKGGLGLGLAVVKGLIEMHGGSVDAASGGPGQGAAFKLTLPLEPGGPSEKPPAAGAACASRRVLIIEDNVDSADMLATTLQLSGHVVEVARTGRLGVEKASAFKPQVVLCDIGLPDMNGYEVARTLRADPVLGRVMLVALSGYAAAEDVAMARAAGFDAHLAKPAGIEALEGVLGRVRPEGSVAKGG